MDRDIEIELVETIQEKDKRIRELETINENITRELLSRTNKLNDILIIKNKIIGKIEYIKQKPVIEEIDLIEENLLSTIIEEE